MVINMLKTRLNKRISIYTIFLLVLAFGLNSEFAVIKIDQLLSISLPTILVIIVLYISMNQGRIIVPRQIWWMLVWLGYCQIVAIFISPIIIGHQPKLARIAYETVYFLSLLLFFEVGYLLESNGNSKRLLKYTAYISVGVAFISILVEIFRISDLRETFYMVGKERFSGLVGNPNDYMPIALIGFSYWMNEKNENLVLRIFAVICILFSFLAAGSKTSLGIIPLYLLIRMFENMKRNDSRIVKHNIGIILMIFLIGVFVLGMGMLLFQSKIHQLTDYMPALERLLDVFRNPQTLLNANGSERVNCWMGALMLIKRSPIFGVGIGSSGRILSYLDYPFSNLTPHQIYLELMAQCGLPLFSIILYRLWKCLKETRKIQGEEIVILRHIFYLMMLNGLFFASDWSIAPWVFAGMFFCKLNKMRCDSKGVVYDK